MPTMNVNLTDDLAAFVAAQLAGGGYANQSEVVRDALRLLRERAENLAYVRAKIAEGDADVVAGRVHPFDDHFVRDVVREGRELARKRAPKAV
jgi:antitoxin ParD1/3/4